MKPMLARGRGRGLAAALVAATGGAGTIGYAASMLYIQLQTTHGSGRVVPVAAGSVAVVLMTLGVAVMSRAVARGR